MTDPEARNGRPAWLVPDEFRTSLPWEDESIDALDFRARRAIGTVWSERARSELSVSAQFVAIRAGFERLAANAAIDAALASAIADEARHARLCNAVGNRYSGMRQAANDVAVGPLVRFGDADERVSLLLHLVLLSCINEVSSTFYLRSAMKRSRTKLASAALRELLADDIEHARIGWTYLASGNVDAEARRHVSSALPTLFRLSYEVWENVSDHREPWFADHGCPGSALSRTSFELAVPEVILPGMAAVGVDPGPGERWFSGNVAARRV
jgi:hypothetical protein